MTYLIGLTGNIATGKSLVLRHLGALGAQTVDADALAHEAMQPGTPAWAEIREHFGEPVLDPGGEIDRRALGAIVFSDPHALAALESIVHPRVAARVRQMAAGCCTRALVVEAIKLLEAGLGADCDAIWVTTSAEETQLRRLIADRGLSESEARVRIEAQPPSALKVVRADVLLENDRSREALLDQVDQEWAEVVAGTAPGMVPEPGPPRKSGRAWHLSDGRHEGAAVPVADGTWRLAASSETRMPRLFRPLLGAVESETRAEGRGRLSLLLPDRTGYRQFASGMGYLESQDHGRESGEILLSRELGG